MSKSTRVGLEQRVCARLRMRGEGAVGRYVTMRVPPPPVPSVMLLSL